MRVDVSAEGSCTQKEWKFLRWLVRKARWFVSVNVYFEGKRLS